MDSYAHKNAEPWMKVEIIGGKAEEEVPPAVTEETDAISPLWYVIPICAVVVIAAVVLIVVKKKKIKNEA